jgi:hypothetical protein
MAQSSSQKAQRRKPFKMVRCPHCHLNFKFWRSTRPDIDECGFESYRFDCPRCDAGLCGIVDPADDRLLLSSADTNTSGPS